MNPAQNVLKMYAYVSRDTSRSRGGDATRDDDATS